MLRPRIGKRWVSEKSLIRQTYQKRNHSIRFLLVRSERSDQLRLEGDFLCHQLCPTQRSLWVQVQYAGQKVEEQTVSFLFGTPRHPYIAALLAALPERATGRHLLTILGVVPVQFDRPSGCLFAPRCQFANQRCQETKPTPLGVEAAFARCHFPLAMEGVVK